MLDQTLKRSALQDLPHDGWFLFLTRFIRLFSYGSLSVVLVFYLTGLKGAKIEAPAQLKAIEAAVLKAAGREPGQGRKAA